MTIWQSLCGMLRIRITSANLPKTLNSLSEQGVSLHHIEEIDTLTVDMTIFRSDYPYASSLCKKNGNIIQIKKSTGIYWKVKQIRSRPLLVAGILLLLVLSVTVPTRVLFIQVEGNVKLPQNMILEAAEECGVVFGVSRRSLRSEKVKNALLEKLPDLQWAGINTYGCRAVISVRERRDTAQSNTAQFTDGIVAIRDGLVTSCTVTSGNAVCHVGQSVKRNQLLISPYVDCGISVKTVSAEGDVYAHTNRIINAILPSECTVMNSNEEAERRYALIFGKKRINLYQGSGISPGTCGRIYEEYYLTLPGGFRLPICLAVETIVSRTGLPAEVSEAAAKKMLTAFSLNYVSDQMIAGTVLSENHTFNAKSNAWRLNSSFICNEMISRVAADRNGDLHG